VIALTDHDTTAGWREAAAACPPSLTVVPGVEISCNWTAASPPVSFHLLGYWFDETDVRLVSALRATRDARRTRGRRVAALLAADGIDVDWDAILAEAAGGTIGRPHLARALVRRGLVPTIDSAFAPEWLGERYHLPKTHELDLFEAVDLVNAAGGVAVLAHPLANRRGPVATDQLIVELARRGLAGLETDHPEHTVAERGHLRQLASTLGMVATGSSDFHGSNKVVPLAACTTRLEAFERLRELSPRGRKGGFAPFSP
jgi:predicted metal-dependent phosphoesterase TrpH